MKKIVMIGLMIGSVTSFNAGAQERSEGKSESRSEKSYLSTLRSAGEIEASCRVKAKEIAADTYRGCVTEQKTSQIEQIKKDYLAKIKALKSHYENELKKIGGKRTAVSEAAPLEMNSEKEKIEKNESSEMPSEKPMSAPMERDTSKAEPQSAHSQLIPESSSTSTSPKEEVQPSSDDAEIAAMAVKSSSPEQAASKAPDLQVTEVKVNDVKPDDMKSEAKPDMKMELKADSKPDTSKATVVKSKSSKSTKIVKNSAKKPTTTASNGAAKTLPAKPVVKDVHAVTLVAKAPKKTKITEMTVHLKPATVTPSKDESTMDVPEPVPVENVSSKSAI